MAIIWCLKPENQIKILLVIIVILMLIIIFERYRYDTALLELWKCNLYGVGWRWS